MFLYLFACHATPISSDVNVSFKNNTGNAQEEPADDPTYEDPTEEPLTGNIQLFEIEGRDFLMGAVANDDNAYPDEVVHLVELNQPQHHI